LSDRHLLQPVFARPGLHIHVHVLHIIVYVKYVQFCFLVKGL